MAMSTHIRTGLAIWWVSALAVGAVHIIVAVVEWLTNWNAHG
jgi:hypothetical protein